MEVVKENLAVSLENSFRAEIYRVERKEIFKDEHLDETGQRLGHSSC